MVMPLTVRALPPVFVSVTDCGVDEGDGEPGNGAPNCAAVRLSVLRWASGSGRGAPVPLMLSVADWARALLLTTSVPVIVPSAVGWKLTLTLQLWPTASETGQLLLWVNWLLATIALI